MSKRKLMPILLSLGCATAPPVAVSPEVQKLPPAISEQPLNAGTEVIDGALYVRLSRDRAAQLSLPPGWATRVAAAQPQQPRVIEGVSLDGLSRVKITLFIAPPGDDSKPTVEQMGASVKRALAPYISRSVEGEVQLKQQKLGDGLAVFATATDKTLDPNGPMPERSWLRFTMGNSVHQGFVAVAVVYSKAEAEPGLSVWHSLRSIPFTPMRTVRLGPLQLQVPMPEQTELVRGPGNGSKLTSFNPSIGFNLTLHAYPIAGNVNATEGPAAKALLAMATKPTAKGCQAQYVERLGAAIGKRDGVRVDPKSIAISEAGAFVRYRHLLLATHPSQPEPLQMPNSFTFLGGEGHCTVLHLSLAPATGLNRQVMKMVEESLAVVD